MTTGERIRNMRKNRKLTQKKLGELCGIAEPTIRRYELGKLNPKYETLERIAAALHTSTGALLGSSAGNQLKYKVKQWLSLKDSHLEMDIDSELLEIIHGFAEAENLSLEDKIEQILHEYAETAIEEEIAKN